MVVTLCYIVAICLHAIGLTLNPEGEERAVAMKKNRDSGVAFPGGRV